MMKPFFFEMSTAAENTVTKTASAWALCLRTESQGIKMGPLNTKTASNEKSNVPSSCFIFLKVYLEKTKDQSAVAH